MASIRIALQTIRQIDSMIQADQGAAYRGWLGRVMPHIGDAYRTDEDGHRSHLGASILGQECARAIWFNFRWYTKSSFEGRIVRLFNRGHIEEARFIAILLMLGAQVYQQDENGKQFRIHFADGHGGGSGDGIATGLTELSCDTLIECKTHSETSFISLAGKLDDWRAHVAGRGPFTGKGVRESKFEHFVQSQIYMRLMGLAACLYLAVNKNTDDLYAEIIPLDARLADEFIARGDKIVWLPAPPDKINKSPGFWKCRFCEHKPVCHLGEAPDRNCRTCVGSEPRPGAEWYCNIHRITLSKETQLVGCEQYKMFQVPG